MNAVILPCFLSPLRHCSCRIAGMFNVKRLTQSCIQYLHNFTLSQHETEIYPLWRLAPQCSLCTLYHRHQYLFMSILYWQLPHRFKFDFATANYWLKGTWNIYFNKILSTEWHEERKHQGYFCFWNLDPLAAAVIWDGELEAAADWLQTLNDMTAWGLLIAPSHQ